MTGSKGTNLPGGGSRKLIRFQPLGIPHLLSLGNVELLASANPLEPHVHSGSFEICVHYEGRQYYEIDHVGYETKSGEIFLSFPDELHSTGNQCEEKSKFFYIIFECALGMKDFLGLDTPASDHIVNVLFSARSRVFPGAEVVRPVLAEIIRVYNSEHPLRIPRIKSLVIEFFYKLCLLIDGGKKKTAPDDIAYICDYIETHPTEAFSVHDLANLIFLSDAHFKRKFKQYTSFSPHDYLLRVKVDLAKEMLRHTYMPVTEISQLLNISSSQMFSKIFKKYTGRTPGEYRAYKRQRQF